MRTGKITGAMLRKLRLYLSHAETLAWRGVAHGDLETPRRILDHLRLVQPFADARLPELAPAKQAAVDIDRSIQGLYRATEVLEDLRTEVRLAKPELSKADQEILRVLLRANGQYLRRGQVHERLRLEGKPTVSRVGQILAALHHEGLLFRSEALAQGSPQTAFYALSPHGREVCKKISLSPYREAEADLGVPWLDQAIEVATSPEEIFPRRRIATGLLCKAAIGERAGEVVLHLYKQAVRSEGTLAQKVVRDAFQQVVSSSIGGQAGEVARGGYVCFRGDLDQLSNVASDPIIGHDPDVHRNPHENSDEIPAEIDYLFKAWTDHRIKTSGGSTAAGAGAAEAAD